MDSSLSLVLLAILVVLQFAALALGWKLLRTVNRDGDAEDQLPTLLRSELRTPIEGAITLSQERMERATRDDGAKLREEIARMSKDSREELATALQRFSESSALTLKSSAELQKKEIEAFGERLDRFSKSFVEQMNALGERLDKRQESMRQQIEQKLGAIQEGNEKKLDEMRAVVDEKLQKTLEARLGESFKLVSERLEQVHKGLGEMQTLATGVGDLKKVLTNVKTRGTWGEIQLGSLLEQVLAPEQYVQNAQIKKGSQEVVEFAIRLPGKDDDGKEVLLPIDSKFSREDYERLVLAQERGDADGVAEAGAAFEAEIKRCARDIRDKYISPPRSTDFAILFLPVESLFAEVLRRPGLCEQLQRDYRVSIAGPTTLAALLNSLQMGFRTLAIQKRSSEVWKVLGGVKQDFGKFGDLLEKVNKKLTEAQNTIADATTKTRVIERRLKNVESENGLIGEAEQAATPFALFPDSDQ